MAKADQTRIEEITGRACVLRGDDIDTDRIIPARFMKVITFEDLGQHAFADDRKASKGDHPLDDDAYAGSEILIVGKNFGCGSSREHAPQSLMRFGFRAFIGESFAEIFAGNCTSMGLVCITLPGKEIEDLRGSIELDPQQPVRIEVAEATITSKAGPMQGHIPSGTREQLTLGRWNSTSVLLEAGDAIERTGASLSYVSGY
ncbi:MAG: 3-isopropylmalate dehydratase small subunit [Myxococcota bacterium]|nr:3-isopropylmalate dehydratase small subunit [Myxococcota bacterium]